MSWIGRLHWPLVAIALGLTGLGVAAIGRASGTDPLEGFGGKQLVWAGLSIAAMIGMLIPHYRLFERQAYVYLLVLIPALGLVLLGPPLVAPAIKGARRWIRLPGLQIQPSELVKIAYICALAKYLMFRDNYRTLKGLVPPLALTLVPMVLILKQPDLGTSLVFVPVLFAMLFVAGARVRHLAVVALLGVATLPAFWMVMNPEQRSRILGWIHQADWQRPSDDDGYHLWQSKMAIGSGGLTGRDPDSTSWVELGYLPEARTDFIFAVVGESWGFTGCLAILGLYGLLAVFGLAIAGRTREPFGRLAAVGVVVLLASQLVINAGMAVGLLPITGMTLPFVSYGGSSLLSSFLALGLLLNIGSRKVIVMAREPFVFKD